MKIKLTKNHLRKMVNEAIDEFKNTSTERFNTDPTYRNMIDVNGIEDEDEFINAIDNHQFNPNYARENGYNDVADKWEERAKKYPEGFVRDQFGNWIDDGGDDIDESRRKNKVRLTERQLHSVIKESVRQMLSELDWKTYANAAGKLYHKAREGFGQYEPSNVIPFDSEHGKLFKRAEDLQAMANKRFKEDYGEANYKTNPKGSEEYLNRGNYEYEPNGRGWYLKDNMDESIRRAIRKALR